MNAKRRHSVAFTIWFTVAALMLGGSFTALGIWQIHRLAWKRALIAQVESRIRAKPVAAPRNVSISDAYRRVMATGRFQHDKGILVRASTMRGSGYWVMTPLETTNGLTLLVNRGFVPVEAHDDYNRPKGLVAVTGLLRLSEPKGDLLRNNNPGTGQWYSRDVAAIAANRRLTGPIAPYFVDADATPGSAGPPYAGLTVVAFPNNHLVYAITWFALAVMTAGAYAIVMFQENEPARV